MSKQKNKTNRDQHQKNTHENMRSLKTAQEEQLEDVTFYTPHKTQKSKSLLNANYNYDEEEQQMLNVSLGELKDTSTDKITAAINELIAKNKISAKNAFDVPMIHLKQTKEYNSLNGDNNWKKISSTLDSNNKIYGYRVDATHNHTYKVLQLLTRQEKQNKNIKEEEVQREELQTNFLQFQRQEHAGDEVLFKYLQKNYKGINIVHLEVFFNVNPILEKTKRIFDQQGLRGLLLNNIQISKNLLLKLSFQPLSEQQRYGQQYFCNNKVLQLGEQSSSVEILRSENIFTKIYNICCLNDLIEKQTVDGQFVKREDNDNEIDLMWKQLQVLAKEKLKSQGNHQNLIDLNSELNNLQEQNNYYTEECNLQPEVNVEKLSKQDQNITNQSNLSLEIAQNKITPIQQINFQNVKQPKLIESKIQATTQGIFVRIQNELTNNNKTQVASNEQKQIFSSHQCQNKPFLSQILCIQSENTPLTSEFQLTKASNLTDPLLIVPRHVPISQVIRLSKKLNRSQLFLKQIQAGEEHDKDENQQNVVDEWKKGDKKAKTPRKPKKTVEKPKEEIDFFLDQNNTGKKLRQKVLKIQKVRKLELKKFMKELKGQRIFEKYVNIDTSRYKFDFKFTTFYREEQSLPLQAIEYANAQQPQKSIFQTNMLCDRSSYIDLIDQNNSSQTKTVSLKYVKHKIHSFIFQQKIDSFTDIYFNFINSEGQITPALCFLTVLHLTYQHGLRLQGENEDIKIFHGGPCNLQ